MFLSFKVFISYLAIVGVVMGQTSNNNSTIPGTSKVLDISEECRKVLADKEVIAACGGSLVDAKASGTVKSVCDAPVDGKAGHFCTNDQLIKVLETMESSCKDELEKKQESVRGRYLAFLQYPIIRDFACKKDPDGTYCVDRMTDEGSITGCQTCTRLLSIAQINWNPIRSNSFAKEIVDEKAKIAKQLIERCDMVTNNSSSSSNNSDNSSSLSTNPSNSSSSFTGYSHYIFNVATIGSTAFVVIGAMVLSH
ncbi:hypothetical protein BDF19DRAFT_441177 [Syncephalis fuscata]|nr:hypothetical protein BDF19DRAFT_441177 [Syncephalis fuscata]